MYFMLVSIIVVVVLAVVVFYFSMLSSDNELCQDVPATGYSSYLFRISTEDGQTDEEREAYGLMKEGESCVLMSAPCAGDAHANVWVWYRGVRVGRVYSAMEGRMRHILHDSYPGLCVVSYVSSHPDPADRIIHVKAYYADQSGTERMEDVKVEVGYQIVGSVRKVDKLDLPSLMASDEYCYVEHIHEFVCRHLDYYGQSDISDFDKKTLSLLMDDDSDFKDFVLKLHQGYVSDRRSLSAFLCGVTMKGEYGDRRILKRRIYAYLESKGIVLC